MRWNYNPYRRWIWLGMSLVPAIGYSQNQLYEKLSVLPSIWDAKQYRPVVALTVGPDFVSVGQAQSLSLLPPFENYYTRTHTAQTMVDAGGFLGVERTVIPGLLTQLGVSAYVDSQMMPQGDVWQFGASEFDDLAYSYRIHHYRVMFTNKILTTVPRIQAMHPYLSWELGTAYNDASQYQEAALVPLAVPTAPFVNHTQSSLAWGVGAGVDYNLNAYVRLGVGYQYADLGRASLGVTSAATTTATLNISHLYTNQLRVQFTVLV